MGNKADNGKTECNKIKHGEAKDEKKVPKLRFPGFSGEWKERKLGEVAERYDNLRVPVSANLRIPGNTPYYGANGIQDYVEGFTHDGEFVLVAEDGANDLKNYPVKCVKGRIWVNNHAHVLQGKTNICNNKFLAYSINQADIESLIVGSGRAKLNADTMMNITLAIPNLREQSLIGDFTDQLDNLITRHQQKLEHLEDLKKGMLQKMFPKEGETVPEVRFPGFTGKWEQKKMSDAFVSLQNNTLSRAELNLNEGKAFNIHYGDILTKFGEILDANKETLPMINDSEILEKYKESYLKDGDVVLADTAEDETVGKCSEIIGSEGKIMISGLHTIPYRPLIKFSSGYLGYYMNSEAYHSQLFPLMQGIKVTSVSKSAMRDTTISYPESVEEQEKIAAYFRNFDNLITLHKHRLEHLKELKKGLLQQMFV